jgi:hypothetical protein
MAIKIDFNITSNPYFIRVEDFSDWGVIEAQPSIIEIYLPGDTSPVTHYFDKGKTNVFDSINLIAQCQDCSDVDRIPLSDGIYVIKVIGSPSTYNKELKFLKTDLMEMEIDKLFIENLHCQNKESFKNQMTEIEFLLRSAEAHLRYDQEKMARMLYEQVERKVEKLKDCKTCSECE